VLSFQQPNADSSLIRGIGPWALIAFAIDVTVGAGIFGLPARIQALVGNYSVVVLVICGLLMALIAFRFAEIGSRFDRSGGPQLYGSIAFGPGGSPPAGCVRVNVGPSTGISSCKSGS
jgi:amino acid transporter